MYDIVSFFTPLINPEKKGVFDLLNTLSRGRVWREGEGGREKRERASKESRRKPSSMFQL